MAHDSTGQAGATIEVTDAMIEAGLSAFDRFWMAGGPDECSPEAFLRDSFISMNQAAMLKQNRVNVADSLD